VTDDEEVGVDRAAGRGELHDAVDRLVHRQRHARADGAAGCQADMRHQHVRTRLSHRHGLVGVEDIRSGQQIQLMRLRNGLDLLVVAHAGGFQVGTEVAVDQADGGEVLDAGESHLLELLEEDGHQPEGIGAVDAGEHRRVLDDRQHLRGHLDHDGVRVAVGKQAGQRAAACHAVAPRVVDDQQVGAARLGAFRRDARARAAADDGLPCSALGSQSLQRFFTRDECHWVVSFELFFKCHSFAKCRAPPRCPALRLSP